MINKEKLYDMYWNKGMSQKEIGEEIGKSQGTVYRWMKKYNIETRLGTKDHDKFITQVKQQAGCKYEVLSKFIRSDIKVLMKHNKCGYQWEVTPSHFLHGTRCPKCAGNIKRTTKTFKQEIFKLVGNEYTVLGDYINSQTNIKIKHNKCGLEWMAHPNHFLNGTRCPNCSQKEVIDNQTQTHKEYCDKLKKTVGDEYEPISQYINGNTKITMRHNDCGYKWEVYPYNILRGHGCPKCKSKSNAEDKVYDYFTYINIDFEHQVIFEDCRNDLPLPFDFGIYKNNKLILIELDGQQHYHPIKHWGGKERLKYIQNNDAIKDKYCKEHNIPLIRIPYWQFDNIEKILSEKLDLKQCNKNKQPSLFEAS